MTNTIDLVRQKYEPVYTQYREIVQQELRGVSGPILKLDLYNEEDADWKAIPALSQYDVTYIEINPRRCRNVHARFPELKIVQGDIRHLPFRNNWFSALVDLSTIDHIYPTDVAGVIGEYRRVLVPGGKLIMVAWHKRGADIPTPWSPDAQYYLDDLGFLETLKISICRPIYQEGEASLLQICGNT